MVVFIFISLLILSAFSQTIYLHVDPLGTLASNATIYPNFQAAFQSLSVQLINEAYIILYYSGDQGMAINTAYTFSTNTRIQGFFKNQNKPILKFLDLGRFVNSGSFLMYYENVEFEINYQINGNVNGKTILGSIFDSQWFNDFYMKDCVINMKNVEIEIDSIINLKYNNLVVFDSVIAKSAGNVPVKFKHFLNIDSLNCSVMNCFFESCIINQLSVFVYISSENQALIKNSSFTNISILPTSSVFLGISSSSILIEDCNFTKIQSQITRFLYAGYSGYGNKLNFTNILFTNVDIIGTIVESNFVWFINWTNVTFNNCFAQGIHFFNFVNIFLVNVNVFKLKSPVIYMRQQFSTEIQNMVPTINFDKLKISDSIKEENSTTSLIYIQIDNKYNMTFKDCEITNNTDSKFLPILLLELIAKISFISIERMNFSNNMNFQTIFQMNLLNVSFVSSTIFNNTNIQYDVISYIANDVFQKNLTVANNSAYFTIINIGSYSKTNFQLFKTENLYCLGNKVEILAGCLHFKPPFQGNFTVKDTKIFDCKSNYDSGAVDIYNTMATFHPCYYLFTNVLFVNNSAKFEGGVASIFFHQNIYMVKFINCTFFQNYAPKGGSLVLNLHDSSNTFEIFDSTFKENLAQSAACLSLLSGNLNITRVSFTKNQAIRGGALESISYSQVYLFSCIFTNITARNYGGIAVILDHSLLYFQDITVNYYSGQFGGLAYLDSKSKIFINQSSFFWGQGNTGAFIYMSCNGELSIYNTTLTSIFCQNSVFFFESSLIDIKVLRLSNTYSTIFDLNEAEGSLVDMTAKNLTCTVNSKVDGCVFSLKEFSNISVSRLLVDTIDADVQGGVFYLTTFSVITVKQANFKNVVDEKTGAFLYIKLNSQAFLYNITVFNVSRDFIYGLESYLTIENFNFNNPDNYISRMSYINIDSCPLFSLNSCIFTQFSSNSNGGLIYLSNEEEIQLKNVFLNCIFSKIKGKEGGVIYNENSILEINNSRFSQNYADDGGSIYNLCVLSSLIVQCSLSIFNNTFTDNFAVKHGGAIKWEKFKPIGFSPIMENFFINNKAGFYGNDRASFPIKLAVQIFDANHTLYSLEYTMKKTMGILDAESGQKVDFSMEFFLIDEENQIIKEVDQAKLYLNFVSNELEYRDLIERFSLKSFLDTNINYTSNFTDIAGQTSQNIDESSWSFLFDDLTITAKPSSIVFLKVTSLEITQFRTDLFPSSGYPLNNYNLNTSNYYAYYIPLKIRGCVEGEIYDNSTNTCFKCVKGTYSYYIFDEICKNCMDHSECRGGNEVVLEKGYWRSSNVSEKVYRCTAMLYLCEGGVNSKCLKGYKGKLCEICEDINGNRANKNYFGLCQECADTGINILISIPMMIGVLIILRLLVNFFKKRTGVRSLDCALIKLLIIHYQMLTLIPNVNTSFGQTPNQILGGLTRNWFSYDCIFGMVFGFESELNSRILSINLLLGIFFGISTFFLMKWKKEYWEYLWKNFDKLKSLVYLYVRKEKNEGKPGLNNNLKQFTPVSSDGRTAEESQILVDVLTYHSVWLYLIQSSMLDLAFLGMRCIEIDGISYNRYSLNYECWSEDHFIWIIFLYVPNIILWSVLLTVFMYKFLLKAKQINKRSFIIASVGLKKKYRLKGDIMNLVRKSIVIIINTFSNENSETIPFTIFLLISFLLLMHFYTRPYNYKILNNLDAFSLYIVFLTYYTLSYYYTSVEESLSQFFYVLLILLHLIFCVLWLSVFFRKQLIFIINRVLIKNGQRAILPNKKKPN